MSRGPGTSGEDREEGWLTGLGGEVCGLEHRRPQGGCGLSLAQAGVVGCQDADILCA